jgi:hypothetical protein
MVPIPPGNPVFSSDGKTATVEMKDVAVRDEPKFPALDAISAPARMSFKLVVRATDQKVVYDDPLKQFRVDGYLATAQLEAQISVPSVGFYWKSDPLESSKSSFGVIGDEANGRYYTPTK